MGRLWPKGVRPSIWQAKDQKFTISDNQFSWTEHYEIVNEESAHLGRSISLCSPLSNLTGSGEEVIVVIVRIRIVIHLRYKNRFYCRNSILVRAVSSNSKKKQIISKIYSDFNCTLTLSLHYKIAHLSDSSPPLRSLDCLIDCTLHEQRHAISGSVVTEKLSKFWNKLINWEWKKHLLGSDKVKKEAHPWILPEYPIHEGDRTSTMESWQ